MVDLKSIKAQRARIDAHGARERSRSVLTFALMGGIAILVVFFPTTIVITVGMVPTVVAFIVDVTPGRYACRCVAGLNVAGVAPFLHKLWTGPNDLATAIDIISDPFSWLVFYGASAIGWLLFLGVPNLVTTIQMLDGRRRANLLRDRQKRLVHEWGESVRTDANDMLVVHAAAEATAAADKMERRKETGQEGDEGDAPPPGDS